MYKGSIAKKEKYQIAVISNLAKAEEKAEQDRNPTFYVEFMTRRTMLSSYDAVGLHRISNPDSYIGYML